MGQIFILPISIVSMNWLLLYDSNLCVSISFCKTQIYLHFPSLLNNEMAKMIKMPPRITNWRLLYTGNIMSANVLAKQGTRALAAMVIIPLW